MISRKAEKELKAFYQSKDKKALLITGARQVGKTYLVDNTWEEYFKSCVKINFIETPSAVTLFENASDSKDLLLRISAIANQELIPNDTLIFFDEVQECKEIVTAIKFLVEEGSYKYVLSGSLLGVELKDIRSVPVGYMDIIEMYPMDFEEFIKANGVSDAVINDLEESFHTFTPVDTLVHQKMMELFRLYLIVGGMPSVVNKYLETNNIKSVIAEQNSIVKLYQKDIAKYDPEEKLYLKDIFELIPSELNSKNKRFILKELNQNFKFSRYQNSFIWLKEAGVALPTYTASEPKSPLKLSKASNLFKLFLSDVGLLSSMYMNNIQIKILNGEKDINFGSVYENVVAQELKAHGFDLYYFNSKKQGELDFVIEIDGDVVPIEVKSGKDYKKHNALTNVLNNSEYDIKQAFVLQNENVDVSDDGRTIYFPIYMMMFIQKTDIKEDFIYTIDVSELK